MASSEKKRQGRIGRFFSDFKAFISKGNILDMAVGVIIGGAFGKIVTSLVNDIIMPLITIAVGGKSVQDWKWVIKAAENGAAESALNYGLFLQSIIDFLIIAFFIFLALRIIMNFKNRILESEGVVLLSKDERKKLSKEFRRQGHSRKETALLVYKKEKELTAAAVAEKKAATEKEVAEKEAVETSEDILKDIREILKQSNIKSKK